MSDILDQIRDVKQLPIFPLPLVLLPNEMLPLHIFEPKYQQMLTDISLKDNLFGVVFFEPIDDFVDRPESGSIGCVAEVRDVQTLPDGRSNILSLGIARFNLLGWIETEDAYLVGDVAYFDDDPEDDAELAPLAEDVYQLFRRIAKAAHKLSGERTAFPEIPRSEPVSLSFLIATAFNLEADQKLKMLKTRSTIERLTLLKEILDGTVSQMEESAEINKIARTNGHSKKKLDL
ncbi:MAG: LON peptidase substrate-binding domain-containing protein [Pyrinomonadaceae bacterium]|nr:LON peptidase substrate-binding domain-containing protein [Pyrinomonadaceae bacterium]